MVGFEPTTHGLKVSYEMTCFSELGGSDRSIALKHAACFGSTLNGFFAFSEINASMSVLKALLFMVYNFCAERTISFRFNQKGGQLPAYGFYQV